MIRRLSDRFWNYLTDRIEARMHLRPDRDNTLDLGSSDYQWRRVYVGPGSAAAPAVTLDGDTDTGIYQSAANNLGIATGGVQRVNVNDNAVQAFKRLAARGNPGANQDAEVVRLGRADNDIRYHSIHTYHAGTPAGNYVLFKLHDGSGAEYTGQADVLRLYGNGNVWIAGDCSALSFTDRTPYPDRDTALAAVCSMRQDSEGLGLDHKALHPYVASKGGDGGRNLSATVSAQNVVIQELLERIERLENQLREQETPRTTYPTSNGSHSTPL